MAHYYYKNQLVHTVVCLADNRVGDSYFGSQKHLNLPLHNKFELSVM